MSKNRREKQQKKAKMQILPKSKKAFVPPPPGQGQSPVRRADAGHHCPLLDVRRWAGAPLPQRRGDGRVDSPDELPEDEAVLPGHGPRHQGEN